MADPRGPSRPPRFPAGFVWGAATSAYQIEGAALEDGAGASIWDRFAHEPGRIRDGRHADVACDHYHRWREDVDLMAALGLRSYRFSIAWSRVLPDGTGAVNRRGLDFYSRLVDALLERGIVPNATLYHWDLPAALQDRGGWEHPDVEHWFADYARVVFDALDDRVPMWATLNEPAVVTDHGFVRGVDAPGVRDAARALEVAHHLMLAHGAAVRAYRAAGRHSIGLVVNLEPKEEASDVPEDRAAAVRADVYTNRLFLDAALLGRYPSAMRDIFGSAWTGFPDEEMQRIRQPLDWVGVNYYTRRVVCHDDHGGPARASGVHRSDVPMTAMGWEIIPAGLTHALRMVKDRYGDVPLYVTENGAAFDDAVSPDGAVHDPDRVAYLRSHLAAVADAIDAGVDVRGYYAWSLLDNFEWHSGFSKRFGLVRVDYDTLERTPKDSARFYAEVIRSDGAAIGG